MPRRASLMKAPRVPSEEATVIVEYIRFTVPEDPAEAFESAYQQGGEFYAAVRPFFAAIEGMKHYAIWPTGS